MDCVVQKLIKTCALTKRQSQSATMLGEFLHNVYSTSSFYFCFLYAWTIIGHFVK